MAYAAAASLSQTINLILNYHHHSISPLFKTQITYLHERVIFLLSFLEDFPDEACAWEERMREVTNEAEDIIELLLSTVVGSPGPKLKRAKYEIPDYHDQLERVTKKIDLIVQGVKLHTKIGDAVDDDLAEIISQLRGGSSALESIPIVGSGGTGKTTLARRVYNHPSIVMHFRVRGWVTVSQNYRHHGLRGIILSLLHSMNNLTTKVMLLSDEELLRRVFEILHGRKYLIVLDDLWSAEVWEWLKDKIPVDFNGSRILITSRLLDVACCAGFYSRVHEMSLMNVDQSWNLLRNKIFKGDPCPPKLEHIGKMIAGSCRGVPLAIEVVSGVLAANQTPVAWEDFKENIKSQPSIDCDDDDEHLLQILHLSYIYLPHHLRPCFLYLGIFQEDQEIHASNLIRLWEAKGFLNQSECQSLEQTGEEHLEDLARRCLISVVKRKSSGKVKNFMIHDLVREMCVRQAHVDNLFLHVGEFRAAAEARTPQRRVSFVDHDDNFLKNVCNSTIRTVICSEGILGVEGIQCLLEYPRLLRILDFSKTYYSSNLNDIPGQLFELFHLRYLAFNFPCSIPKAILNLEALQTLAIGSKKQQSIIELPVEIWRMPLLKHIVVHTCKLPRAEGFFCLENLQTLTEALNFSFGLRVIVPNLKKLSVSCIDERIILLSYFFLFRKLEILKIRKLKNLRMLRGIPLTLKKLSLGNVGFFWEDMKILGLLRNLQVLKLRTSRRYGNGSIWETNEGEFCELKFLHIEAPGLKHWITKSSHFPRLKGLVLRFCDLLEEFPYDFGATLESIELDDFCQSSLLSSAMRIKDQRKILGSDTLNVQVVEIPISSYKTGFVRRNEDLIMVSESAQSMMGFVDLSRWWDLFD